ncbi:MAG: copper amine oxidase N-terminal domain-containing protein [Clostridiales bacterium]|nr:copper amine oxidase N-terminal domain-containing protein [Clostridiales bacterium]
MLALLLTGKNVMSESVNIVSSVSRLDLNSGRVLGEKADYFLDIPTMWSGYLSGDRELITNSQRPLEKLNFYYMPSVGPSKPALFLSVNIYSIYHYNLEPGHKKLVETNRYVFTVYFPPENTLTNKTDIAIYNSMKADATDEYLTELIRLSPGDEKLYDDTIWVNGIQLDIKAITDGSVTYLPLRAVCERLGYSVGWLPEEEAVTMRRGDVYEILLKDDINANLGFSLVFNKNITYISSLYFISVLKLNVEIDERKNVTLNES